MSYRVIKVLSRFKLLLVFAILTVLLISLSGMAFAAPFPNINIGVSETTDPQEVAVSLQILFLLTILSLAPALLIMLTSFTRIVIVLSFIRNALGTQQIPPTAVLVGLALFLTFFVMAPVFNEVNSQALSPYLKGEIKQSVAFERAEAPIREFMLKQTSENDLSLFVYLARLERPRTPDDLPTYIIVPSFIIGELKKAFLIGFLIYIPFLVIDMVVASTLMSMGMLMLPPILVSLPIKLLLFVLVDGWHLITRALVMGFN